MKLPLLFSTARLSAAHIRRRYNLYDRFATALAAGAVNGTLAEPVGGMRTVVDTNSKISVSSGLINFATGAVANDGVWWTALTRRTGVPLFATVTPANTNGNVNFGWDSNTSGAIFEGAKFVSGGTIQAFVNSGVVACATYTGATTYQVCSILRNQGTFLFIKGGVYANWTLIYDHITGANFTVPVISAVNTISIFTATKPINPKWKYIPIPLESDDFSTTVSDGNGNAECNAPIGHTYTAVGTWGVSTNAAACSALSGGVGFRYLATTSSNVNIHATIIRSAGVAGIVARYVDANNYLIAYLDGTNAKLDKVVAGTTTNLISAAVTYGATKVLCLRLNDTGARLFYGDAAVGAAATTPAAGSLNHGLYTTDTGNSFKNLIVYATGNEGQYANLENLKTGIMPFTILGDSIAANYDWVNMISGWTPINHAVGGATIASALATQVPAAANDNAGNIVIELGTNDDNAGNMTVLQSQCEEIISLLKSSNPNAEIHWMNVLPRWTDNTGATPVDKTNIRTAIAAACTAQSITCWDTFTTPWLTAAQTPDGLHPNSAGLFALTAQVLKRIRS